MNLTIMIDDTVVHEFVYDKLECVVEHAELTLTATREPTGTVRDGLLPTGTFIDGPITPSEARSRWGEQQ